MAVSIAMMFGRLGSAFGTNIIAYLLDTNCQYAFYMSGLTLIGKLHLTTIAFRINRSEFKKKLNPNFTVSGVMTFFIPNIHQKNVAKHGKDDSIPRPSILSAA